MPRNRYHDLEYEIESVSSDSPVEALAVTMPRREQQYRTYEAALKRRASLHDGEPNPQEAVPIRRVLLWRGIIVSWARGSRRQIGHSFFSRSGVCYAGFKSSGKLPRKGWIHISQIDLSLKESPWLSGGLFNRTLCGLLSHVGCHVSGNLKTRHQILKLEGLTSHEPLHKLMKGGSSHNASPKLVFKVSFEKG